MTRVSCTTTHAYNQHGELTVTTDAHGITVTRTVDELDRVTFVDYPDDALDTDYVYDDPSVDFSNGRLTAITRTGHTVAYEYDRFGRTTRDGELGFGYDENGNRTGITYPGGVTAAYEFDFADRADRLSVATDAGATTVVDTATYFPSGPLHTLDFGTGVTETRTFDQRYFPESIALDASQDRTWTYATDDVGNVTEIVSSLVCAGDVVLANETVQDERDETSCAGLEAGPAYTVDTGADVSFRAATRVVLKDGFSVKSGASFAAGTDPSLSGDVTRSYSYQDVDYFLTEATGPWATKSWTYDRIGNRLTETDGDGTDTYSYTPNPAGGNTALLESVALPTLGTRDFQYTPAGHQIQVAASANVVDFDYDDGGRLETATRSTDPPTTVPFHYDGRGFLRHTGDLVSTGTVEPLYDSAGLLHGLLRQPSAADPQTRYLVFYLAGRPVAQAALETGEPERWWYLTTDHLGTPLVATDGAGEELWENRFEPFGRDMDEGTAASALASEMFLRFPGQWEDDVWQEATMGAEVFYNVYRWLDPNLGRYSRTDPLGVSVEIHPYLYVNANPVGLTDRHGLFRVGGGVPACLVEYLKNRMPDIQNHHRILSAIGAATGSGVEGARLAQGGVQWGQGPIVVLGEPPADEEGRIPFGKHLSPFSDIILLHPRDVEELCRCGPGPDGLRLLEIGKTLLHELTHWVEGKVHGGRLHREVGDTFEVLTYGKPPGGTLGFPSWRNNECCDPEGN